MSLRAIYEEIDTSPFNAPQRVLGYHPVYSVSKSSKIVIVGQAPGRKAQETGIPWNDASGVTLRSWLGVSAEQFYDNRLFGLLPMDFYFPGKGQSGDIPPRKDFAPRWHPRILQEMNGVELMILVGSFAQNYYLGDAAKKNLTETVRAYRQYLPKYLPLVHPSPLNFRWQSKNRWFEEEVVPLVQDHVQTILLY